MSRTDPRRIVVDADGGFYYTDDHYQSFRRIAR
jgi:guanyl-specific ribonuclease Sa